jgi:hypothetical protein
MKPLASAVVAIYKLHVSEVRVRGGRLCIQGTHRVALEAQIRLETKLQGQETILRFNMGHDGTIACTQTVLILEDATNAQVFGWTTTQVNNAQHLLNLIVPSA